MDFNTAIRGGKFNKIEGDYTVIDRSRHETNIESYNMYYNKLTESYNNNSKKMVANSAHDNYEGGEMGRTPSTTAGMSIYCIRIDGKRLTFLPDGQRREDYTRPPFSQPHQPPSASSRIENRDSFNIKDTNIDNAYNDNSKTHYYGPPPPVNQRVRQNQTHNLPPFIENSVLPQSVHQIDQRMRQKFENRSLSEGDVAPNMSRYRDNNDDDDESDEDNNASKPPPLLTSSSEPIYTTYKGNVTKHDNSVHETNILSHNTEGNEITNCFNYNYNSSRQGREGSSQQVVSARE